MKQKILNQVGMLLISSVLITFLVVSLSMYDKFGGYMKESVREEAWYIRLAMEETDGIYLAEKMTGLPSASRITLLDPDGAVLFDSAEDAESMENHADRPEFQEALEKGAGEILRYSDTLSKQTFYYALRLENGDVLRVARTTDTVLAFLHSSITLMGLLVFAIIIAAFFITQRQTSKLIEPINQLDLEHPLRHVEYEELRPLLLRVHDQNKQIARQVRELKERHEEYLAITENMKDGLVVASPTEVLSINKTAQGLFQVRADDCIHKPVSRVSRNQEFREALEHALAGEYNETVLMIRGRSYQLLANPVSVSGKPYGVVILIWDITEQREAEQLRREFSANVSHELKTPLMSISGYAELIENGMARPEDIPEFAGRIHQEASRLTALVQDIIQLSKLEEGTGEFPREEVNLYDMTREVIKNLESAAQKKRVEVLFSGEALKICGVRHILFEMLYNLVDNGIKYNVENGWLRIKLWESENKVFWQVKDSGIGIAGEDQERIFERFYRVDKSHSRQTGGTGLGLSIVKHGALMHGADIRTESQPGEGTMITLEFPKGEAAEECLENEKR